MFSPLIAALEQDLMPCMQAPSCMHLWHKGLCQNKVNVNTQAQNRAPLSKSTALEYGTYIGLVINVLFQCGLPCISSEVVRFA